MFEHLSRLDIGFLSALRIQLKPSQVAVIRLKIRRRLAAKTAPLDYGQLHFEGRHNLLCDLVLHGKNVLQVAVIPLGPYVKPACRVKELRCDPDATPRFANTAFQHIAHPELSADLLHLHRLAFVGEDRIPRDDKETRDLREISNEIFSNAVTEILL